MKKWLLLAGALVALILLYLWLSYARIYYIIGKANLKSPYQKQNMMLQNSSGTGTAKYVVLGDSLSAGVGSSAVENTYPYIFAYKLSRKYATVELINLAHPGDKTKEVIINQLNSAVEEKPDYITLLIGINDLHNHVKTTDFEKNFGYIVDFLESKTSAKIIVLNLPYLASIKLVTAPYNLLLYRKTKEYNQIIRSVVEQRRERVKLIDLYSNTESRAMSDIDYYSSDLFHPSGDGYILWSRFIYAD